MANQTENSALAISAAEAALPVQLTIDYPDCSSFSNGFLLYH